MGRSPIVPPGSDGGAGKGRATHVRGGGVRGPRRRLGSRAEPCGGPRAARDALAAWRRPKRRRSHGRPSATTAHEGAHGARRLAAQSSAIAFDLATGEPVFGQNADGHSPPLRTRSSRRICGAREARPAFRFRTALLVVGHPADLSGTATSFLRGGGGPTLAIAALRRIARRRCAQPASARRPRVLADESSFDTRRTAPGWKPAFFLNESPPLSTLIVEPAGSTGSRPMRPAARRGPSSPASSADAGVKVDGRSGWAVAPLDATPLAGSSRRRWPTDPPADGRRQRQLHRRARAEVLGAVVGKGRPQPARASSRRSSPSRHPARRRPDVDGSGLSRLDRLTPLALASVLLAAWNDPTLRPVLWDSLAVAGGSGTLKRGFRPRPTPAPSREDRIRPRSPPRCPRFVGRRFVFSSSRTAARSRRGGRGRHRTGSRPRSRGRRGPKGRRPRARARCTASSSSRSSSLEQRHARLLRLRDLRARAVADDDAVVFLETLSPTFAPSASSCRCASSRFSARAFP